MGVLRALLEYVYKGSMQEEVVTNVDMMLELLMVADMYSVQGLTDACAERLVSLVSGANVRRIMRSLEAYANTPESKDCLTQVRKMVKEQSDLFDAFLDEQSDLLNAFLDDP